MADQTITLRIVANSGQALGEIRTSKAALRELGEEGNKAAGGVGKLVASTDAAGQAASRMGAAIAAAKVVGVTALATAAARASDMMASLAARIGLVSDSARDAAAAQSAVVRIAQQTGTSIEATGTLYVRLANALKDTGASQREVAGITETVNKAMTVSGATAAEASGAITQLAQGFAAGALRGDEFNSVNEAAPRLMDALAKSLGVTRGELRQMAEDGKLTAGALRAALSGDQAKAIAAEFSKLPATIGRAWQQLINSATIALSRLTQDSGAYALASTVLSGMSRALDVIVPKLIAFGSLLGSAFRDGYDAAVSLSQELGGSLLKAFASLTGGTKEAATALKDDLLDRLGDLARNAASELQILPVSLRTIMTIAIGEFDKLRIGAIEKFQLLVVAGQQAWLSLRAATSSLANDMRTLVGSALDGIVSAYAKLVGGIGNLAGKLGLDGLQSKLAATSASLLGMADSESKARAAADASSASYTAERAVLDQRAAAITATADRQRAAADSAIQASLDERQAALDGLSVKAQELELSDRVGQNKTKNADAAKEAAKAEREAARAATELANARKAALDMLDTLRGRESEAAKALSEYAKGMRELQERMEAWAIAGGDINQIIEVWQAGEAQLAQQFAETNADIATRADVMGKLAADTKYEQSLIRMTARQRAFSEAYKQATDDAKQNRKLFAEFGVSVEEYATATGNAAVATYDLKKEADDLDRILSQFGEIDGFDKLVKDIGRVKDALAEATDPAQIERLQRALGNMRHSMVTGIVDSSAAALRSMQSMTTEGSRAFQGFQVAIDALALVQGISAILNQGQGDPYTAPVRMAAMAAAIAPLIANLAGSIGAFKASGFSDTAAQRQATQGTGSVLGDAAAKSESISKAVEITANATQQLVGLNRGMLTALQALQSALGAAGGQLARGAAQADFSGQRLAVSSFDFKDPLTQFILGGSSKVTDQGIRIFGGALTDLLNGVAVGAYQEVQSRSWLFGSTQTRTGLVDVSDQFGKQFSLVISSIVDTVRAGATALGLLPADIEARLAAFRVESINISLKGLSAEDQQKEIEAVFSKLFDDIAGSVVPFIGQFQRAGEGLGETLVRIATEVQVAREAFRQLGMAVDQSDPERFAQISDALIQAAGGLDAFISGMQSFVANFAPEGHQLEVASTALASAFEQVGLSVPATRDGMWELMQSLDATTESGRAQIATLLRLADVSDQYYDALDAQARKLADARDLLESMGIATGGLSDFGKSLVEIKQKELAGIEAANMLAKAHGREGASAVELAAIHTWTAKQIAAAIRKLQAETRDLIAKLYGGVPGSLDAINARIAELEQASVGWSDSINEVAAASDNLFERWRSGVQSVQEYLDSMLLGDLSALTPEEQLAEAQRQLMAMQQAAMGGDADALNKLPQLADAYLRLLRGSTASGADYTAGFDWVRQLLGATTQLPNPGTAPGETGPTQVVMLPSPELAALYAARDAALAQQETEYRAQLAAQLTQHLADLAVALNVPILDLIAAQGVSLRELATDLGADLGNLTGASVEVLGNMATTLGVSLTALTSELGLTLADLSGGLTELTQRVGIDLSALTVESTQSLAALASSLGLDLSDLATAVGVDLGNLADAQSLLNQALAAEIQALPGDQRDQLAPLLDAITAATTEADANDAIRALEDAVNAIGGDAAAALAPYLSGVMPPRALDQLDYLADIQSIAADQLDVLGYIRDNLKAANAAAGVPSYAVGTGYVPRDGLAMIHEGEAIIPAPFAAWMRTNGLPVARSGGGSDERVIVELRGIRERLDSLERSNAAGHNKIADTVERGDAKARLQRDDIARRNYDTARSRAS